MRLRTLLALAIGAAAGAGATYLLDPERGIERRRVVRRNALRQARALAVAGLRSGRERLVELGSAALQGYREGRDGPVPASAPRGVSTAASPAVTSVHRTG